jgi:HK97 gp10 family phage protein
MAGHCDEERSGRMTKVRLTGFRELERALKELPKATGKNVLRRVGKAAMEPMADSAAAKAPHAEGRLAFSIVVSEKRTRRVRGKLASRAGIQMAMGPSTGLPGVLNYAAFVEFGKINTPAQPYMRPAWDQGAELMLQHVKDNLGSEISKAAGKLAKKRAKAGG